jgi:hypothetical protein
MNGLRFRALIAFLAAPGIAFSLALGAGGPAQAEVITAAPAADAPAAASDVTGTIPGPAQTCSSGEPKLDYEWGSYPDGNLTWSNVCGIGTWTFNNDDTEYYLWAVRMPTTPSYRIWLHQDSNGDGLTACFTSDDVDVLMETYANQYLSAGFNIYYPGNVQVSDNSAPC